MIQGNCLSRIEMKGTGLSKMSYLDGQERNNRPKAKEMPLFSPATSSIARWWLIRS
jgi:hypothetical protein